MYTCWLRAPPYLCSPPLWLHVHVLVESTALPLLPPLRPHLQVLVESTASPEFVFFSFQVGTPIRAYTVAIDTLTGARSSPVSALLLVEADPSVTNEAILALLSVIAHLQRQINSGDPSQIIDGILEVGAGL